MVAAAGPFTTSDSLDMEPLYNLLEVVKREKPNVLLLVCLSVCLNVGHDELYHNYFAVWTLCGYHT